MPTYTILLTPQPEGGYTVTVPALPGVVTQGETVEECAANAREAIGLWIEDMDPVPIESEPPRLLRVSILDAT